MLQTEWAYAIAIRIGKLGKSRKFPILQVFE